MRPELATAIGRFRAARGDVAAGVAGDRLGAGLGASLEPADVRDYAPGDDVRRIDWRAYARTDRLKLKLYREETSPHVDVLLDVSASMATTDAKACAARDLVEAWCAWCVADGGRPRIYALGGERIEDPAAIAFDGRDVALAPPTAPLRPRSLRRLVSDFLTPDDPAPLVRRAAAGAAGLAVVQILDPWEVAPEVDGVSALVDVESGARRDLRWSAAARRDYDARLRRLCDAVREAVRAAGGRYALATAAAPAALFGGPLLAAGLTEPR